MAGRRRHVRQAQLADAKTILEAAGFVIRMDATAQVGHAELLAHAAVEGGADLLISCGGDGTLNEIINGMAGSPTHLAVLPGGTANGFARELRCPLDIAAAARRIVTATPRRIALGRTNGRYFASMTGVGFDAHVLRSIQAGWKKRLGVTHYGTEALKQALISGFKPFLVCAEGKRIDATLAIISRVRYYGPFPMIAEADLRSEQFVVYCFPARTVADYVHYAAALFVGRLSALPDVIRFRTTKIRCERLERNVAEIGYQVDGELAGNLPAEVEIVPDALTVLMP